MRHAFGDGAKRTQRRPGQWLQVVPRVELEAFAHRWRQDGNGGAGDGLAETLRHARLTTGVGEDGEEFAVDGMWLEARQ